MLISSKGRYALRIMLDLAQNGQQEYLSLKEVSERQDISLKYLENIVRMLHQSGLIQSLRGKNGGYRLVKAPQAYSIGEILRATENGLKPVSCISPDDECTCDRAEACITLPLWQAIDHQLNAYLDSISLEDVLEEKL